MFQEFVALDDGCENAYDNDACVKIAKPEESTVKLDLTSAIISQQEARNRTSELLFNTFFRRHIIKIIQDSGQNLEGKVNGHKLKWKLSLEKAEMMLLVLKSLYFFHLSILYKNATDRIKFIF